MTCCWPQERGTEAHTLACLMATPDLYVVGGKDDPTARKAIAEARAELCACGVRKCKEHGEESE